MADPSVGHLTVDLAAIRANWVRLRQQLKSGECGAVVKADAYGLGVAKVAPALWGEGCRQFFVANLDEGIHLRSLLGSECQVFVLQGCPKGAEADFIEHRLIPVIVSMDMFERWKLFAKTQSSAPSALKLNTGMNRFGVDAHEFHALIHDPLPFRAAQVEWLMSHLACADTPRHPQNARQLSAFAAALSAARRVRPGLRGSLANSAGIFLGGQAHCDLARPGIALYGGMPRGDTGLQMQPVVSLKLPVVQVRHVAAGESIGYGADCEVAVPVVVAAVAGGYADGILRSLAGAGQAWFGRHLPLLGRVSMDCCVFDVTELAPHERPAPGDWIELLGEHVSVDEFATAAGTISYEVLTRLGHRFARQYVG